MEDFQNLQRLQQENERILAENRKNQEARNDFKQEYVRLKEKLSTLTDKVSYSTMVPVGTVGFFQGELIHTNELMVLLGDNWFVERSTKQACQIVERRIEMIDKQLIDLKKEHDNILSTEEFTNHFQQIKEEYADVKEIKEDIPLSYQSSKKGKRIAHQPKHNKTSKPVKFDSSSISSIDDPLLDSTDQAFNHAELFARLNELEKQEETENQLEHEAKVNEIVKENVTNDFSQLQGVSVAENFSRTPLNEHQYQHSLNENVTDTCKKVKFVNDAITKNAEYVKTNNIRFSHTPSDQKVVDHEKSAMDSEVPKSFVFIESPSDIYEQFRLKDEDIEKPLKSILKKDSRSNSAENLKLRPILKTSPEHCPGTPEQMLDEPRPILKTPPDTQISDMRPITPEYIYTEEPRPILKSSFDMNERLQYPEYLNEDPQSILKSNESFSNEDYRFIQSFNEQTNDEVKSILKSNLNESTVKILPILEEDRKSILKSPLKFCENHLPENEPRFSPESRTILKNTQGEVQLSSASEDIQAFSGSVIERNMNDAAEIKEEQTPRSNKRMSKFKASRKEKY